MNDITTEAGRVIVSNAMLADRSPTSITDLILGELLEPPPSTEQLLAARAEREAIWDENTAHGLVGIVDWGDETPNWHQSKRGDWVDKWVLASAWQRYVAAAQALTEAEEALDRPMEVPS